MKNLSLLASVAVAAIAFSVPAMAQPQVTNDLGVATGGAALTSTNSASVSNAGVLGALTPGLALPNVVVGGPTITNAVDGRMLISSIGAASSVSSDTTVRLAAVTQIIDNNLNVQTVTASNSTGGTVANTGLIHGALITSGSASSISIQSIGASAGMSSSTVFLPAP